MSIPLKLDAWGVPHLTKADVSLTQCLNRLVEESNQGLSSGQQVDQIRVLDLRGAPLEYLPENIDRMSALEELYLSNNDLCELPARIGLLPSLRVLSLGQNKIHRLPDSCYELWDSLAYLFLGDNHLSELPFVEADMSYLRVGSIGTNPLEEPLGRVCWMLRADALEMPERLSYLVSNTWSTSHNRAHARLFLEQAIALAKQMNEPMIYESFFDEMHIDNDGKIHWNNRFSPPKAPQCAHIRQLGLSLLPVITRGACVDPSLWAQNIHKLDLTELSFVWHWDLCHLPMLESLRLHPAVEPPSGWVECEEGTYRPKSRSIS